MMEPFTSRKASISSYLDTRPSPFTSSNLKIFVISLRLIRSFGDKSKSSISFLNYGKSMKLLWFSSYFLKIFSTALPIISSVTGLALFWFMEEFNAINRNYINPTILCQHLPSIHFFI